MADCQKDIIAFTSARKKASIIVDTGSGIRIYTKGGPDFLGKAVTHIIGTDGARYSLDDTVPADPVLGSDINGHEVISKTVNLFAK